eukprot:8143300-Pyramimonas_sp.AAC.1
MDVCKALCRCLGCVIRVAAVFSFTSPLVVRTREAEAGGREEAVDGVRSHLGTVLAGEDEPVCGGEYEPPLPQPLVQH